jgi:hypothetical protein
LESYHSTKELPLKQLIPESHKNAQCLSKFKNNIEVSCCERLKFLLRIAIDYVDVVQNAVVEEVHHHKNIRLKGQFVLSNSVLIFSSKEVPHRHD